MAKIERMKFRRAFQRQLAHLTLLGCSRRVDFIIAGTMKGGTTALDVYLREHPEVALPSEKELHFFDHTLDRGGADASYASYHRDFALGRWRKLWGEATPNYMYWHAAPGRIREYNPQMKLIVCLRNPVSRAYSHWNMMRDKNREKLSFWDAIQAEPERLRQAEPKSKRDFSYMDRGRYAEQLERIWQYFPRNQTLVLKSEDLRNQPQATLDIVSDFLGVKQLQGVSKKDVHSRSYEAPMGQQEKEFLQSVFAPEIKKLEQLLGWDCQSWLKD